jgi:anti-sigma regulatory factor (Ser/Thr protein kinase)
VGPPDQSRSPRSGRRLDLRVRAAREEVAGVRQALGRIGLPATTLADAGLLVSELLSNSIKHSGLRPDQFIRVTVDWSVDTLRVTVRDGSSRSPGPLAGSIRPPPGAESGWGLYLVNRVASRWGTLAGEGGYWFELQLPEAGGA